LVGSNFLPSHVDPFSLMMHISLSFFLRFLFSCSINGNARSISDPGKKNRHGKVTARVDTRKDRPLYRSCTCRAWFVYFHPRHFAGTTVEYRAGPESRSNFTMTPAKSSRRDLLLSALGRFLSRTEVLAYLGFP